MDIHKIKIGNNCFGNILEVNGLNYDDLDHEEVLNYVVEHLKKDYILLLETFKSVLEKIDIKVESSHSSYCAQCGENSYYYEGTVIDDLE